MLLVVDYIYHCIYRFTLVGGYIKRFGVHGESCANDRIMVFDQCRNLIHKLGSTGSEDGKFSYSCKVAVNKNGDIYVSDCNNKRIQNKYKSSVNIVHMTKFEKRFC